MKKRTGILTNWTPYRTWQADIEKRTSKMVCPHRPDSRGRHRNHVRPAKPDITRRRESMLPIIWTPEDLQRLYVLCELDTVDRNADPFQTTEIDHQDREEKEFPVLAEGEE